MRTLLPLLMALGALLVLAPGAVAGDGCDCCRVECVPARTEVVYRQVMCPPVTTEREVPVTETVLVPVTETRRVPVYRTVEVPVYDTVEVPVTRTVEVPVYGPVEVPVYTCVERPVCLFGLKLFDVSEQVPCGTRVETRQVGVRCEEVVCGTRPEQVMVGTEPRQVLCGYECETVEVGTRETTRVVGCRTETVVIAPARLETVRECVVVPALCVTVSRSLAHAERALPGTTEVMSETEFAQVSAAR
jgi:hypothetical protein